MLRGLLRMLAYALAFWFVYRVVVAALRYLSGETRRQEREEVPRETKKEDTPAYHDVKDARFKDLPDDSSKPS